ncbi:hypothetical protein PRK78_002137 [Emydomyces testavorans]|uniref:Uncharacterized protein n=1 Tax=Emydomyces testavorans TaxID=2070801 RepID=A0AAF0DEH4_9EURO|nr:hypothetical protein PRK78_002137 [Emydomyces testavorans]
MDERGLSAPRILIQMAHDMQPALAEVPVSGVGSTFKWSEGLEAVRRTIISQDSTTTLPLLSQGPTRQALKRIALQQIAASEARPQEHKKPLKVHGAIPLEDLPPARPVSSKESKNLKNVFEQLKNKPYWTRDPYISMQATTAEDLLIGISGKITISPIDADDTTLSCIIASNELLWDTGSHITAISRDLIDSKTIEYMHSSDYATYRLPDDSFVCQADAILAFTNTFINVPILARIIDLDRMPNRRSGVLLGQLTFIDSLYYEMAPRAFLRAQGINVSEDMYGEIKIKGHIDTIDDCVTKF